MFILIMIKCLAALASPPLASGVFVEDGVYSKTANMLTDASLEIEFPFTAWAYQTPTKESADKKHKNKHRDNILLVSENAIPEDLTLVVWFHGLEGFSKKTFRQRIIPQLNLAASEEYSFAIAIPEMPWSTNTSTPRGRQKQVWKSSESLTIYIKEIRERLDNWSINKYGKKIENVRLVFVGHSAGGSALSSASRSGGLCNVEPDLVVWSDATYGSWFKDAWYGCLGDSGIDQHVLVRKWGSPYTRIKNVVKEDFKKETPFNVYIQILNRKHWTHGKIGDNVLELAKVFVIGC